MSDDALRALLAGGGIPTLSLPPTSRYVDVGVATHTPPVARGEQPVPVAFLRRRLIPRPERFSTLYVVSCEEGDRRDLLAARHLGDPELWWRLADANVVMDPAELAAPVGRVLRVTLPADVPGGGDG
jgi:hypothetical protein